MKKLLFKIYLKIDRLLVFALSTFRSLEQKTSPSLTQIQSKTFSSSNERETNDLAIVITTFEARFDLFALPLIRQIRNVTNTPIYLIINGNYLGRKEDEILRRFLLTTVSYTNVFPIVFNKLQGCAKLWNTGIINAEYENTLIMNDDVLINEDMFLEDLLKVKMECIKSGLVTINSTWSFFCIAISTVNRVGFFDERFLGFGEEDGDYIFRFQSEMGFLPTNLILRGFINVSDESRDSLIAPGTGKYSLFNTCLRRDMYKESDDGIFGPFAKRMKKEIPFSDPYPVYRFRQYFYDQLVESDSEEIFLRFQMARRFFND